MENEKMSIDLHLTNHLKNEKNFPAPRKKPKPALLRLRFSVEFDFVCASVVVVVVVLVGSLLRLFVFCLSCFSDNLYTNVSCHN